MLTKTTLAVLKSYASVGCRSFCQSASNPISGDKQFISGNLQYHWKDPNNLKDSKQLASFIEEAKTTYEQENGEKIDGEDVKSALQEWYLRKLEENKWTHFMNQVISSRYSKPYNWELKDAMHDWSAFHKFPMNEAYFEPKRHSPMSSDEIQSFHREGVTSIDEFQVSVASKMADDIMDDHEHRPAYLWTKENIKYINKEWQNKAHQMREFTDSPLHLYQMTDERLPYIPETYYDPHVPLPAYRNHESLLTSDPRNVNEVEKGDSIESEKAMMMKNGIKLHKRQQDQLGVAYTPDYDFDLWSEDPFRPHSLTNTYNMYNIKKGKKPIIQRVQLTQRKRMMTKSYVPNGEKLVEFQWKSRMTRNQYQPNRSPNFCVIKICGNGRGCAGIGFGRGKSFEAAAKKADYLASTNMMYLPRYLNHTIAHPLHGKYRRMHCVIEPRPLGYGERGPILVKAICHAFGIRDYCATMYRSNRMRKWREGRKFPLIKAIWNTFLRASTPEMDCENRGSRMVEAYPEKDGTSYHLPRGYAHDNYIKAKEILHKHQQDYEQQEGFNQYEINNEERLSLPEWITNEPNEFWEGGMPDISNYKWRPDLIDLLQQKGSAGIPHNKEKQIQRLLAEKVDPCDHHFRWMKGMIQITPNKALGM